MYKYKVESVSDEYDCDTCGPSWATGYVLKELGTDLILIDLEPIAHCFGGQDFEIGDMIYRIQSEFPDIKFSEVDFTDCLYSRYVGGNPNESS